MKKRKLLAFITFTMAAFIVFTALPSFATDYSVNLSEASGDGDSTEPRLFVIDNIILDLDISTELAPFDTSVEIPEVKLDKVNFYFDYKEAKLIPVTDPGLPVDTNDDPVDLLADPAYGYEVNFSDADSSRTFDPAILLIRDIEVSMMSAFGSGIVTDEIDLLWKWDTTNSVLLPTVLGDPITITLEWTNDVYDDVNLDAYLFGPQHEDVSSDRFVVYSGNKGGDYKLPASLDQDSKVAGTETITIYPKTDGEFIPGDYCFSVRFKDKGDNERFRRISSITITIDDPSSSSYTYTYTSSSSDTDTITPPNGATYDGWRVFKLTLGTDGLTTPINDELKEYVEYSSKSDLDLNL